MESKEIIDKIRKVLALTTSSNEGEAKAAILMAQKIMVENHLIMSDINMADRSIKQVVDEGIFESTRMPWFFGKTARIIADNFRCYAYIHIKHGSRVIQFVGLKEDVELAKMIFSCAIDMIHHHSKQYMKTSNIRGAGTKNLYIVGYLDGLKTQFAEQVRQSEWGLVLVKDALVTSEYRKLHLRTSHHRPSISGDESARSAGFIQGKQFKFVSGKLTQ